MPNRALRPPPLLLLLLASLQGCDAAEPCDPDQRFEGSVCWDEARGAGAGGSDRGVDAAVEVTVDAGADAGDAPDAAAECTEALDEALGVPCSPPGECGCAAPYCAAMPGQSTGYCTTTDCDPAGDDCPSGYQCFDLSAVGVEGFPTFCVPR